jgi:serine/threonine-protein kinase
LPAGLTPGVVVAGYQLESQIGAGGMAAVFRARDERLGRTVALKVLAPALAGDGEFRERFIRESRAAAAVDHPHIIPVYGAGEAGGILYLAMRHVSGGDLRSVMRREGPLPAERAAFLLSPVASALDAAHAAGLVHRDVKPANVLVDTSPGRPDHPYLSDFGLAKGATSMTGLTGTGQFLGTADYAAPEQISGGRAHVQTDQYALACVAFTMLTGTLPFARDEPMAVLWAHLNDPPPSATAHRFDLSPAVDQVLGRALAKNPAARYPSCGAFADALRVALGTGPYSVPVPAYPGQPARGGAYVPTPGAPTAPSELGWAAVTGESRPPLKPVPLKPGGRRRGVLAAASAVAVLAGAAVVVAVLFHPGSDKPQQMSSGNPGSQATGHSAAPATGEAGREPAESSAVTGKPVPFTNPGSVPAVAAVFRSDGSLVTVGVNDTAYIWDVTARQETAEMAAPRGQEFQRAAFSPDGDTMAAENSSGVTYIFRGTDSPSTTRPGGDRIYPGSFATAGLTMVTRDQARTGVDVWVGPLASAPAAIMINPDHETGLTSVALSVDGTTVAASDDRGRTYLWNANTAARTRVLKPPDGSVVNCSTFSFGGGVLTAGNLLVTGDRDGRAYLWNAAAGAPLRTVRDPDGGVDTVAISTGARLLATAGTGRAIHLWNPATGASLGTISDPGGSGVKSLAFNLMGTQLAVADKNGTTYVWNLAG